MPKKRARKRYEVAENETIDQCLERMKKEGYTPIRRSEEPVFKETTENGEKAFEPIGRTIVFYAVEL
ncbi:NETI motif-containing protein [Halobacillus sp. A5]|uniref:NETI motif-containing protein n=1 Tax=Halobacillus sp. A5 TaxID=2880263 RepID=UPI0020A697D7|nr:NETI motif-containing protein [Halobacillus sp. A5]MCP3028384.1 NETI motif-containing protein [Halobacillus sp. A5]